MLTTLEKMRLDADRFARLYGFENSLTVRLYNELDKAEQELDENTISRSYENAWNQLYAECEATVKSEGAYEECQFCFYGRWGYSSFLTLL